MVRGPWCTADGAWFVNHRPSTIHVPPHASAPPTPPLGPRTSPLAPPPRYLPSVATVRPDDHPASRELAALREIVHAFLTADQPEEVYRLALARVTPLVGAAFACVYLVHDGEDAMRLAAAQDWPERWRPWLDRMTVRIGCGPSGEAAAERRVVEVPDVFGDDRLEDWQAVARELGFSALVALPLATRAATHGVVTFYFRDAAVLDDEQRTLLRAVAEQMAAAAEKAAMIAELQRTNARLREANAALEQRNAALVEARRVRSEFLTTISHELRTPLTAVLGYVGLLAEGVSGPVTEEQARELGRVRQASERLLALIDDLLELAALSGGSAGAAREAFDPRDPLRMAVSSLPVPAGTALRVHAPAGELAPMLGDQRRTTRILLALLDNAVKFAGAGAVDVRLAVEDGYAVWEVADGGPGVPPALQEAIFDEFRQADGSITRRHGGAGLGLAIARRLARHLGGDVTVASTSGAGATFSLRLPVAAPGAPAGDGAAAPAAPHGGASLAPEPV